MCKYQGLASSRVFAWPQAGMCCQRQRAGGQHREADVGPSSSQYFFLSMCAFLAFHLPWNTQAGPYLVKSLMYDFSHLPSFSLSHTLPCGANFLSFSLSTLSSLHYQQIIILATMSRGETDGLQSLCEMIPAKSFNFSLSVLPPL